jgi:hypothetical protein
VKRSALSELLLTLLPIGVLAGGLVVIVTFWPAQLLAAAIDGYRALRPPRKAA